MVKGADDWRRPPRYTGWLTPQLARGDLLLRFGIRLQRTRTDWRVYRYYRDDQGKLRRELVCQAPEWWQAWREADRIGLERDLRPQDSVQYQPRRTYRRAA